ncbi:hypothetical protein V2G26_001470 [Clonostachys chloroleuca]
MAPQDVLDEFFRYVQNDIPLRLISTVEMTLVDRLAVQDYYLPAVEEITETTITNKVLSGIDREDVVKQIIQDTVKYAVLSHRWLPRGEPLFHDLINGIPDVPGRSKLESYCRLTRQKSLAFAWSDTCCINKSSSAELDEALRSMFRWYRNATLCLIYLSQTNDLSDLESDEWFTRGWTLQELLAPPVAKFYNKDWEPLGEQENDKEDEQIVKYLVNATKCPKHALRNFLPGPHDVDRRMSWAANRRTTKVEDMAYSLMGIFGVVLQPAYGEGAEQSFSRLVQMIMQSRGSTSVLNWVGKAAVSFNSFALPSSPRCYVGNGGFNTERRIEMGMTSRGLRLPLILLPVRVETLCSLNSTVVQAKMEFADAQFHSMCQQVTISANILGRHPPKEEDWALGVFNYMPPDGNRTTGLPGLRRWSVGYLLWRPRDTNPNPAEALEGMKVRDGLRFYGWKKLSTQTFVYFTLPHIKKGEVMIVKDQLLETVYL